MDVNHNACHLAHSINSSSRRGPLARVNLSTRTGHWRTQRTGGRESVGALTPSFPPYQRTAAAAAATTVRRRKGVAEKKPKPAHHFCFFFNQFSQLLILPVSDEATSPAGSPGEEQKLFIIPQQQLQPASRDSVNILLSSALTRPQRSSRPRPGLFF